MAKIETRYDVGDRVFLASTTVERKQHTCPDCRDTRRWRTTSPAGHEYEVACPRCSAGYQSDRSLSLGYSAHAPQVQRLTIGSVRVDTNNRERPVEYMCVETGVGSGRVYGEAEFHDTEEAARAAADALALARNSEQESWVAKQYDALIKYCDYELHDASLRAARDITIRRKVDIRTLFEDLRDALDDAEADRGTTVQGLVDTLRKILDEFKFRGDA